MTAGGRVLVTAVGTLGDVQVGLSVAEELARRGRDVVFGAPENYRGLVESLGLPFEPILRSVADLLRGGRASQGILGALRDDAAEVLDATTRAARGAEVVVAAGPHVAGMSAAKLVGATYVYLAVSPTYLRSRHHAPLGAATWRAPVLNRAHWRVQERLFQLVFGRAANAARVARGLAPVPSLLHAFTDADRVLFAFAPELEPLPPDVAPRGELVGPLSRTGGPALPAELEAFLTEGAAPVYVGFGSMADLPETRVLELARRCVDALGVRVLLATGTARVLAPGLATLGASDHGTLFPRLRAVVHHGGSGTTYAAARAGVPQAIVPFHGDQGWYGRRVAAVGVGPSPLPFARLTDARFVELVRALVEEPAYRERARALGPRIASHDGPRAAADAVEALVVARRR